MNHVHTVSAPPSARNDHTSVAAETFSASHALPASAGGRVRRLCAWLTVISQGLPPLAASMGLRGWAVLGWLTVLGRAVWAHDDAFVYVLELPPRFNVDLRDAVQQMVRGARHTPTGSSISHPRAPSHPPSSQPCVDPGRGQAGCKARGGQCGWDTMYAVHGCYVCTSNVAQHTAEPSATPNPKWRLDDWA